MISWQRASIPSEFGKYTYLVDLNISLTINRYRILADGSLFSPFPTGVQCRWWRRVQQHSSVNHSRGPVWKVQSSTAPPSRAVLTRIPSEDCKCHLLVQSMSNNFLIKKRRLYRMRFHYLWNCITYLSQLRLAQIIWCLGVKYKAL